MSVRPTEPPPVYTVDYSSVSVPPPSYDAIMGNTLATENKPSTSASRGQSTSNTPARPKSSSQNQTRTNQNNNNQARPNQPSNQARPNQTASNQNRANQANRNGNTQKKSCLGELRNSKMTTRYIIITAVIFVLWDVAGIIVASVYWNECNISDFTYIFPLAYGLVAGIFHVTTGVEEYVFVVKRKLSVQQIRSKKPQIWHILYPIIGFASFILLIHGCINVYNIAVRSGEDARVDEPSTSPNYCHPVLYYFVFSMCTFILGYIGITLETCMSGALNFVSNIMGVAL